MTQHPINSLTVASPVTVQNLTVFPLTRSASTGPAYLPSITALQAHGLAVTEISDGGSVPNLLVENPSEHLVLLLDGEELRGAKQNRIINTTLLLAARSKTVVPVSCTESGRWSYASATFSHSGTVMSTKARRKKTRSVSHSLQMSAQPTSDQGEVWSEVEELHGKIGSHSSTSAMAAAYEKMRGELNEAMERMPVLQNQCGLIAMINGQPVGMDLLSRCDAYATLHPQLVQSYAMEALATGRAGMAKRGNKPAAKEDDASGEPDTLVAKVFLERCAAIKGNAFRSVTLGQDWRFTEGNIVGSGLEFEKTWIHMAYFVDDVESPPRSHGHMARMSRRSRFRRDDDQPIY